MESWASWFVFIYCKTVKNRIERKRGHVVVFVPSSCFSRYFIMEAFNGTGPSIVRALCSSILRPLWGTCRKRGLPPMLCTELRECSDISCIYIVCKFVDRLAWNSFFSVAGNWRTIVFLAIAASHRSLFVSGYNFTDFLFLLFGVVEICRTISFISFNDLHYRVQQGL